MIERNNDKLKFNGTHLYTTKKHPTHQGGNSFHQYEYRQNGDEIQKYKISNYKMSRLDREDRKEARLKGGYEKTSNLVDSWKVGDENLPDWLNKFIKTK
ncbi:MAG: hypothetical protein FWF42_00700 [Streptococcaceae bacterium]|nr:hypothetical protein [Streptococcaceae bacterium]MCL2681585.1 hypothetical protein [Streptococcaceae bacterium]MCL2858187.1 hypothetical protein [Streptococcaceae bacterium]